MDTESITFIIQQAVVTISMVSAPVVGVAVLVGLLVGIAQAVTQIQDQSIGYGVKILVVIVVLVVLGRWMGGEMLDAFERAFEQIPSLGRASVRE